MSDIRKILKDLVGIMSPPGGEKKILEYVKKYASDNLKGAEMTEDPVGNLILTFKGSGGGSAALAASVDEPVFAVNDADEKGLVRFAPLGDLSPSAAAYSEVEFENGVRGTLVPLSRDGERGEKADDPLSYAVDIGASSREEAASAVPAGCALRPVSSVTEIGDRLTAPSAAAKAGSAVLLAAASLLAEKKPSRTVYLVFSSQGKVGARGVLPAARSIAPDAALVLTFVDADPGDGIAAVSSSERQVFDRTVADRAVRAAGSAGVKVTRRAGVGMTPDSAAAVRFISAGVPAALLGVPASYANTPRETVSIADLNDAARTAVEFVTGE